jgi:flagellar protein FliS
MWKDAYLEGRILSADPLELVHILYQHTLEMVQDARHYLATGNIAARGKAISRAVAALTELDVSLDRKAGGSISRNLADLYQYMRTRLLTANIRQEDAPLAEVEALLRTLGEAWSEIRPSAQKPPETVAARPGFGGFAPETQFGYATEGWSA